MVDVIPAILTDKKDEALEMLSRCESLVSRVQLDIIDGVFAGNKTINPEELENAKFSFGLDFHLMVKDPENWVDRCVRGGADRIIAQIEQMPSQESFVTRVQNKNMGVGLAIDLNTPVDRLEEGVLAKLDVVLIMSVSAGFGGQKFDFKALDKIQELNDIRIKRRIPFRICVDGGETEEVIDDSFWSGADQVAIGRRLFKGDIAGNIKRMREAAVR